MGFLQWLENQAGNLGRAVGTAADVVVPGNQSNWHQPPPATTRPQQTQARPQAKPLYQQALNGGAHALFNLVDKNFTHPQPTMPQMKTAANVGQELGVGPTVTPIAGVNLPAKTSNPVVGTAQAIWDKLESNNPNFQAKAPLLVQGANGKAVLNPDKAAVEQNIKSAVDMAGSSFGGTSKFAGVAKEALPIVGPALKQRGLTAGIKGSPNFSPELQAAVSSEYAPATNKAALAAHDEFMSKGVDAAHKEAISVLADPKSPIGKQEVVNYGKTIQALDAAGRTKDASAIHDLLAERLTKSGQTSQAASLLYSRTPEGLSNIAFRDLRNAKVEITPEIKNEIQGHIDTINSMAPGPQRDFATAVLQKAVAKHLPQNITNNLVSVWKAGLLSGTKTQGGNFVSNATFAGLKGAADPTSVLADKALSVVTGQRTKALTLKGNASGTIEGLKNAGTTLKTGIDKRGVGDKYEQHAEINFGNRIVQNVLGKPSNMVFRGMNAADQPFWYSSFKNSMYDQAKADGLNKGLSGKGLRQHMNNLVAQPTEKIVETANHEADKSTLGFDTIAFKAIQGVHKGIDNSGFPEANKIAAHTVINVLAPFTKVPTAFLSRTIDFTPLGPVKEVITQISKRKFDQRALSQAIGEGATGTGVIAVGMALAHQKLLSGDYPKNDPKEAARWKAEGITPNSVKIGSKWVSLNYLGPVGLLFNAGKQMVDASKAGAGAAGQAGKALAGLGQGLLGQSFLQGFSGFSDAISDPARNLQSFVNSQAASVVPNAANDVANLTDSMQRQANGPIDAIKAKIPGLRESLSPKIDAFGNDLSQPAGGANAALNPLKPSNSADSPMLSELNRLGDTGNLVFPVAKKTIGSGDTSIKLTPDQTNQRQKLLGDKLLPLWDGITKSPGYQSLDDAHKADALQRALTDVNSAVDRTMTSEIDSSKLKKAASASVASILDGSATPEDYINKAIDKPTDPAGKYKTALDKFNTDVKAGKLTGPAQLKAEQSLTKQAVTSKYSQEVLDFYSLSNAQKSAYFKSDPQKAQQLYDQAKQLDSQLVAGGGTTKFKTGTVGGKKSTNVSRAKTSKFNYTKTVKATNTTKFNNQAALRKLVRASKITRKKIA